MAEQAPPQPRELSASDNIARYYPKGKRRDDGRPSPAAFVIEDHHDFLSTAWLEYFHCTDGEIQMRGVAEAFDSKLTLRASGRICVLNVGEAVQECLQKSDVDIEVWLLGQTNDPSHTGICGYKNIQVDPDPAGVLARLVKPKDVFCVPEDLV